MRGYSDKVIGKKNTVGSWVTYEGQMEMDYFNFLI